MSALDNKARWLDTFCMSMSIPAVQLGDRMRLALISSGYNAGEMAEYLGVSRTSVSAWLSNRAIPRTSALRLWAMRCEVPYEWLLLDPGVAQAADLAELTHQFPDLDVDHDIYADSGAAGAKLSRLDSNQQPSGYRSIGVAA